MTPLWQENLAAQPNVLCQMRISAHVQLSFLLEEGKEELADTQIEACPLQIHAS